MYQAMSYQFCLQKFQNGSSEEQFFYWHYLLPLLNSNESLVQKSSLQAEIEMLGTSPFL